MKLAVAVTSFFLLYLITVSRVPVLIFVTKSVGSQAESMQITKQAHFRIFKNKFEFLLKVLYNTRH